MKSKVLKPETVALFNYDPDTGVITRDGKVIGSKHMNGHIIVWTPEGPIMAHRLALMLSGINIDELDVHHKNEIKSDNSLANLQPMTHSEHMRLHAELTLSRLEPYGSRQWYTLMKICGRETRSPRTIKANETRARNAAEILRIEIASPAAHVRIYTDEMRSRRVAKYGLFSKQPLTYLPPVSGTTK